MLSQKQTTGGKKVAILHPDLGIGGAEQLIINVALALQSEGYTVRVYTPFFDPNRCFKEAREELDVHVHGDWFPRALFGGRFIALCAYIRMLLCALWVLFFGGHYDYYILDQVSFPVPLLRLRQSNVFFYCHYPDKLLSTDRRSFLKRFYRFFLDLIEEVTTGMAKTIVKVFIDNFPLIRRIKGRAYKPEVVYPSIDGKAQTEAQEGCCQTRVSSFIQALGTPRSVLSRLALRFHHGANWICSEFLILIFQKFRKL